MNILYNFITLIIVIMFKRDSYNNIHILYYIRTPPIGVLKRRSYCKIIA